MVDVVTRSWKDTVRASASTTKRAYSRPQPHQPHQPPAEPPSPPLPSPPLPSPPLPSPPLPSPLPLTRSVASLSADTHHPLHSRWTLYYHMPTSNDWTVGSYMRVSQIRTVEEFSMYYKALDFKYNYQGMFFLMRGDIKPTWEDPHNKKGGCWSFKVSLQHFYSIWVHLSMLLVGESLSAKPLLLNGVSVSPKRGFCIVKIWNHDSSQDGIDALQVENVKYLEENGHALYTAFHDKK
jgi:hypothetical protein